MSETLENSVREKLKTETWTRALIANFTETNLNELFEIIDQARTENCENNIKEICDEQLLHSKDSIIVPFRNDRTPHRLNRHIGTLITF